MGRLNSILVGKIDKFNIRKKLVLLYVFCVMVPLLITDSLIFGLVYQSEKESTIHEMENVANAIHYTVFNQADYAAQLGKGIYTSRYVNDFINTKFSTNLEYFNAYNRFFNDTLISLVGGAKGIDYKFYLDNDTIVNGSEIQKLDKAKDKAWYQYMIDNDLKRGVYYGFDKNRHIYYFQRLNFYDKKSSNILLVEIDYGTLVRTLSNLKYDYNAYICADDKIILSNGKLASAVRDFYPTDELEYIGYTTEFSIYGQDMEIWVQYKKNSIWSSIKDWWYVILILILFNTIAPAVMMSLINYSFTKRLSELSNVFNGVEDDELKLIDNPRGTDEIGSLMRNYNKMANRVNDLIQIVYKNTIKEHEMVVARQNAELLALHSQINPHFLFNALESIRMHSLLKHELETADMVEKLAKMQRQYTEWQDDEVLVEKEIELVKAYLGLQKYRFGDRLSFDIDVEDDCLSCKIPKLSIVTFVENACVHGIESKTTPGWIFVRIYKEDRVVVLEIEDTGAGLDEDEQSELISKMREANIEMLKEKGRVGIVNACLRLKMMTQNQVTFNVESEKGIGTIVTIRLIENV